MALKGRAILGILWSLGQQGSVQGVNLIVQLFLMRLLAPEDFGVIALIMVFISLGNIIVEGGLTSSLIRSKELDDLDYSSVFFLNLSLSILIYITLFVSAPLISQFYNEPRLTSITRVYGIVLILKAFSAIQTTKFTRDLNFKTQFFINLPAVLIGGLVGIFSALKGFGVWSLVFLTISQSVCAAILNWSISNFRLRWRFSFEKVKLHFFFGYKLALSSSLNVIFQNIYNIVIGKAFNTQLLGFYNRAELLSSIPSQNLSLAVNKVTFPIFSKLQDDDMGLKLAYKRVMQASIAVTAPLMTVLIIYANDIFGLLFSDKWNASLPYFKLLCIPAIIYPLQGFNLNILSVKGRTDLYLKLEVVKKLIIISGVFLFLPYGIYGLICFQIGFSLIAFFINSFYAGFLIDYPIKRQIVDILPIIFISALSGGICYIAKHSSPLDNVISQLASFLIFALSYIVLARVFNIPIFKKITSSKNFHL